MDKIFIKNMQARGIIGINDWEREKPQDILINVDLFTANRKVNTPDELKECVDYSELAKKVMKCVEKSMRFTLEALAEDIAQICLEDPRVLKTTVRVEKPGAVRFTQAVGVEIERMRGAL